MNEQNIRKIRHKFILISTLSFFGVMLLMGGFIYCFSEITLRNEVRQIMDYIILNDGEIPVSDDEVDETAIVLPPPAGPEEEESEHTEESLSQRMEWSLGELFGTGELSGASDYIRNTSYFAVLFDDGGDVEKIMTGHLSEFDETQAVLYARIAMRRHFKFGNFGRYYYGVSERSSGGTIVIYIDRTGQVFVNNRILFAALSLLGLGTLLAFFLMRVLSARVVRAEIENAEKQKQFITNASHELKTPLAVIRANTEMQEMMVGETEWTQSTMRQIMRMSGLIENLVKIARADEMEGLELAEVDVAAVLEETAASFAPAVTGDGKQLVSEASSPMPFVTDESMLRQLLTLLMDNAVKYCDPEGTITYGTKRSGKLLELWVANSYADGKEIDYSRFFDRFYRADSSHNTDRGGYGIGLSIAESIAKSLKGEIRVSWKDGVIRFQVSLREGLLHL